ncbi:phosphoribosylanthranilate isomerase [Geopsychrobacter electrodiphilus]|uniref:phosphoribosylanthranilate isomerase n=1 Tax=Geopsychrobacter electrodiphilus TaxID=225196 RepID=UPI0003716FEE|nr:phosphoribosylanthranilate isomerase [Geopsychrobacter electrodiphilus]
MQYTRVKICGITSVEDALAAVAAGADALGFVFYDKSPRAVTAAQAAVIIRALPPFISTVGLFVNETRVVIEQTVSACGLDLIQLHGDETPQDCLFPGRRVIKALRVRDAGSLAAAADYEVSGLLLDAWSDQLYGGSGESFDWQLLQDFADQHPVILAGGLNPQNVAEAIRQVRPFAVDVSSGVESAPGRKDHAEMAEFIRQVRNI